MNAVVCGLVAAMCWGLSDWLARTLSRELGAFRAQLWSQASGFVLLAFAVVASGDGLSACSIDSVRVWVFAFLYAGLIGVAGLVFFEAFRQGRLVVVAPIVGGYGAVTLAWSVLFGARPSLSGRASCSRSSVRSQRPFLPMRRRYRPQLVRPNARENDEAWPMRCCRLCCSAPRSLS